MAILRAQKLHISDAEVVGGFLHIPLGSYVSSFTS